SQADNSFFYGRTYYIEFTKQNNAILTNYNGDKVIEQNIITNHWCNVDGGKIRCRILNWADIANQQDNYKNNRYYFTINNPNTITDSHIANLQISLLNRSAQTILIQYTGNNADKSAHIVNTIAEQYLVYDVENKKESADNILAFIDEQLKLVYKKLDQTEKDLLAFKKENKINPDKNINGASPFPIFTTKINEFEDELINIEFELVTLQRINVLINNNDKLNIYELIASLSGTKSESVVVNVLNTLQNLINQKEQLLNDVTADNLKIKLLEKQIENQKQLLKDFITTTIERLKNSKQNYLTKIEEYEQKIFSDKGYNELEYNKLERLYAINEGFYNQLISKKAEYLISQAGYVSQNTILEKAETPKSPKSPIKSKIYFVFLILGLLTGGTFILIRYLLYDEITSVNLIQNYTNAPILGTIPIYRQEIPVSQLLVNKKPNSV
ncbi:MAG TPA: GNVR domain-containing protein, partial [Paludibacteraceae bacterium]|nr:GNVR domain-containing protein [Paludibacteraceae bacterium]